LSSATTSSSSTQNSFCSSARRGVSSLVVAEHDTKSITQGTLSTITAASKLGGDVSVLVLGHNCSEVAKSASSVAGVSKVLLIDQDFLSTKPSAEDVSKALVFLINSKKAGAGAFTHILAPSSNNGKNYIPRAAALLDCSPVTDVISVVDKETFTRPM